MAYFGGHFLDASGEPSIADFSGRRLKEHLSIPSGDPCFAAATATAGRNPKVDFGCDDATGFKPPEAEWDVTESDGTWGRCLFGHDLDMIGRGINCAQAYIATTGPNTRYENPNVPSPSASTCDAVEGLTQFMQIDCRRTFSWSPVYTPVKSLGMSYHFDATSP